MYKILLIATTFLLFSCANSGNSNQENQGSLRVNMSADNSTITTKASVAEPELTPEMFKIRIEDNEGKILKSWNSYSELPNPIRINPGQYRFVAWYGSTALPAWDTPYYEGAHNFSMETNEEKILNLTCQAAAVKVQINFDPSFDIHYSSYSVDIRTSQDESKFLNFDKTTESKAAYFEPGKMYIRFRLTSRADGQTYTFSPEPIANTVVRESYTLNMSAKLTQGIGSITITTDQTTNDKEPIIITIPRQ